jgi:hypothetical protein
VLLFLMGLVLILVPVLLGRVIPQSLGMRRRREKVIVEVQVDAYVRWKERGSVRHRACDLECARHVFFPISRPSLATIR